MKYIIALFLLTLVFACNEGSNNQKADMYNASELASLMRDMVTFSDSARVSLLSGKSIESIPENLWGLKTAKGTRDEHEEDLFQSLTDPYLNALKGIERGDSQMYYYNKSIEACVGCHNNYCGGPLVVINKLPIRGTNDQ